MGRGASLFSAAECMALTLVFCPVLAPGPALLGTEASRQPASTALPSRSVRSAAAFTQIRTNASQENREAATPYIHIAGARPNQAQTGDRERSSLSEAGRGAG